jgi:hypothetical protein
LAKLIAEKPTRILSAANNGAVSDKARAIAKTPRRSRVLSLSISPFPVFSVIPAEAGIQVL